MLSHCTGNFIKSKVGSLGLHNQKYHIELNELSAPHSTWLGSKSFGKTHFSAINCAPRFLKKEVLTGAKIEALALSYNLTLDIFLQEFNDIMSSVIDLMQGKEIIVGS